MATRITKILKLDKVWKHTFLFGGKGGEDMQFGNLGVVEKKVLGALMILADENNTVKTTMANVAHIIGYKKTGGALTFALRILERDNFIVRIAPRTYKLLI